MSVLAASVVRRRIDADDYFRMAEIGILRRGERVELIDGEILAMAPIGLDHGSAVARMARKLILTFRDGAVVWVQTTIRFDRWNVPEPDFAVLRPRDDFYKGAAPQPSDVLLVIEVSVSSLDYDRTTKRALYARAGIGEYWIVDAARSRLDVYREPKGDAYASVRTCDADETITLALAPEFSFPVAQLIG